MVGKWRTGHSLFSHSWSLILPPHIPQLCTNPGTFLDFFTCCHICSSRAKAYIHASFAFLCLGFLFTSYYGLYSLLLLTKLAITDYASGLTLNDFAHFGSVFMDLFSRSCSFVLLFNPAFSIASCSWSLAWISGFGTLRIMITKWDQCTPHFYKMRLLAYRRCR